MVVQHNLTAMNSNRMLGLTTASQAKSTEKLSSGYKINRAADDAAGLSISEKMRKQIRGLTQASLNAQDGISAVQTAEGALTEVHDMLQRMNELAVKASNGTMSENDRSYVQNEIDQLVTEIDRVSETTKFNETYLLKGKDGTLTKSDGSDLSEGEMVALKESIGYTEASAALKEGYTITKELTLEEQYVAATEEDIVNATTYDEDGNATGITGIYSDTKGTVAQVADVAYSSSATIAIKDGYKIYTAAADPGEYGNQLPGVELTEEDLLADPTNYITLESDLLQDKDGNYVASADLGKFFNEDGSYKGGLFMKATGTGTPTEIGAEQIDDYVNWNHTAASTVENVTSEVLRLSLQVGADTTAENKISVDIESMSAKSLGIDGLKVDGADSSNADADNILDEM